VGRRVMKMQRKCSKRLKAQPARKCWLVIGFVARGEVNLVLADELQLAAFVATAS
jgi:hypothetical protein